jgi:hypothetical protein
MEQASLQSDSDEDEIDEVSEIESLRDEIRDLKISISCIRTGQQDYVVRLAGLERHVKDALIEVKDELSALSSGRTGAFTSPSLPMNPTANKLLELLQESRTGLKKIVRESIRLHMFSPGGGMYAPDSRQKLSGSSIFFESFTNIDCYRRCVCECRDQ